MKRLLTISAFAIIIIAFNSCSIAEEINSGSPKDINWMPIEKVAKKKNKKKKVMVDLYTNWCGWCKRMDKSTFQNQEIIKYLNKNFYSVKFNAEERKAIEYNGKTYNFDSKVTSRGRHDLATELLQTNKTVGFPTIVFLDEDMNIIQAVPGYKDEKEFEVIMTYFAGEHYKSTPWTDYRRNYESVSMNDN